MNKSDKEFTYTIKLVIHKDSKFFGPGVATLLEGVAKTNSLSQTSKDMSLAYTKALRMIKTAEQNLGYSLLERRIGGPSGGGSTLTPNARALVNYYRQFEKDVSSCANQYFTVLVQDLKGLNQGPFNE